MKIKHLLLTVLAGALTIFTSCVEEEGPISSLSGIELGSSYITIARGQQTASTTMKINESWTSRVPEWLTLDPASGAAGDYTLTFKAKADTLDQGQVQIIFGGKTQIIKVTRDGDKPKPAGVLFEEPFVGHGQGDFEIKDVVGSPWSYDAKYGMKATAYINNANTDADSYLISPEIDLTGESAAILTFEDAVNYMNGNPVENYLSVEVTTDNGANWEKVTVPTWPAGSGWDFFESGNVDLSKFVGKKIKFAFHYTSNTAASPTWEVKNVKLSNAVDATPTIKCSKTELTVDAAATSAKFSIVVSNLTADWTVSTSADWIKDYTKSGKTSGDIEVSFDANTVEEARTATFTVASAGAESITLTLTQGAYSPIVEATIAEVLTKEDGDTPYRVRGVVSGIVMDKNDPTKYNAYGNFYLTDETGTIYVYGLLPEAGGAAKQDVLTTKGVKEGDVLTIVGPKASYNNDPQLKNAYFEDHKPVTAATAAEFNALTDGDALYMIKGTIANIVMDKNDATKYNKYGNFDVVDETGKVYVYGIVPMISGKSGQDLLTVLGVKEGDIVTVVGPKASYNDAPQMKNGYLVGVEAGTPVETPPALFLNEFDCKNKKIEIYNSTDAEVDMTGWLLVKDGGAEDKDIFTIPANMGKVAAKGYAVFTCKQDDVANGPLFGLSGTKGFIIELKKGDTIVDKVDNSSAREGGIVTIEDGKSWGRETDGAENFVIFDTPTIGESNGAAAPAPLGEYDTNVAIQAGDGAYTDNVATVNGTANVALLKFGTSKKYGTATITLPAGTKSVSFYGVAWKETPATIKITMGTNVIPVDLAANDGATGNSPFTLTVAATDKFGFNLGGALAADTPVTVETYAGTNNGYRAILFGIQASEEEYVAPKDNGSGVPDYDPITGFTW